MSRNPEKVRAAAKRWYYKHGKSYYRKTRDVQLAASRNYYVKNARRLRAKSRKYRISDPVRLLLVSARDRARIKNLEFSLSREWLEDRLKPMTCEVTGVSLEWRHAARTPSLDRLDPTVGYTEENTRVTTWIYNRARGTFTDEEFMEYVVRPLSPRKAL